MADDTAKEMPQWGLITSHIEPVPPLNSPQAEIKESIDIADVLSKIEAERRDKIASNAPQAWFPTSPLEAPIFVPDENGIHVSPGATTEISPTGSDMHPPSSSTPTESVSKEVREHSPARIPIPRILRLKKSTFYILLGLTIIIVLAIIGGSVGGIVARRSKKAKASSSNAVKHLMAFSLQTWEFADFTGRSQIFHTKDRFRTAFQTRAFDWKIGHYTSQESIVCSMALCLGNHSISWWGSSPHFSSAATWNDTATYADVVNIECGMMFAEPKCPSEGMTATSAFATAPVFDPLDVPKTTVSSRTGVSHSSSSVPAKTTNSSSAPTP